MPPKKDSPEVEDEPEMDVHISFKDLEKAMTTFNGDDTYPIETFLDEFEDVAEVMKWSKVEKLVYAKRLLDGTAKLFLRSFGKVKDYTTLKKALQEEFGPKINSAAIHKRLASRKMKNDETYQQYFLSMKELALHGKVEDAALMEYVIDGIRDVESNKSILYGSTDIKDFRRKLEIYSEFRKKMTNKPVYSGHNHTSAVHSNRRMPQVKRCYDCGDTDHQAPACPKGVKCFRCNEFGHKSRDCPTNSKKTMNIESKNEVEKVPFKKIKINNEEMITLIDTGSDVNLIVRSRFENIKKGIDDFDPEATTCLTGIAEKKLYTEGAFTTTVQIDNQHALIKFHVVKDTDIPVSVIIGNPILKHFEVNFTPDGVHMKKVVYLTLLVEDEKEKYDIEDSKYKEEIYRMCEEYKPNEKIIESKIEHRAGSRMKHADALSRNPICLLLCDKEVVARMKKAQDKDEHIKALKTIVKKEPYQNYILQNDLLYKEYRDRKNIVVPKRMQSEIIRKAHEKGHFSVDKTEELIDREYYIDSYQRSINMTPFELMFGIKMRDKDDYLKEILEREGISHFKEKREELRKKAKSSIQKIQEENIRNYNRKRKKANCYQTGDLVAIKKTQFSQGAKLYPKYLGPYEVLKSKGNDRYTVRKIGNSEGPINTTSSADFMKPWVSPEDDSSEADE